MYLIFYSKYIDNIFYICIFQTIAFFFVLDFKRITHYIYLFLLYFIDELVVSALWSTVLNSRRLIYLLKT